MTFSFMQASIELPDNFFGDWKQISYVKRFVYMYTLSWKLKAEQIEFSLKNRIFQAMTSSNWRWQQTSPRSFFQKFFVILQVLFSAILKLLIQSIPFQNYWYTSTQKWVSFQTNQVGFDEERNIIWKILLSILQYLFEVYFY